jgi:hypothetical protein
LVKLTLSLASKSTKKSKRASPSAFRVLGRDSILVMFKSYFQKYLRTSCKAPGLSLSSNTQLIFGVASGVVLVAEMKLRGIKGKKGQMVGDRAMGVRASNEHTVSFVRHRGGDRQEPPTYCLQGRPIQPPKSSRGHKISNIPKAVLTEPFFGFLPTYLEAP